MTQATKRACARALATTLLGVLAGTAAAQETSPYSQNLYPRNRGPYLGLGLGANFQMPNNMSFDDANDRTSYHTGYVGLANLGYALGNGLRFELEPAYRRNNANTIVGFPALGHTTLMTLMANGIYDFNLGSRWSPHIGAGAGVARVLNHTSANIPGGTLIDGHDTVPAFQAIGGIEYAVSPAVKLGLDYRYLLAHNVNGFRTDSGARVQTGDFNDHAVGVTFRYEFGAGRAAPAAAAPVPAAAAAVAPPPPAPPPTPRNYAVYFDTDSATLTQSAHDLIQQAAADIQQGRASRVTVTGHTDTTGRAPYNQQLSERRADTVRAELVAAGVPADRIVVSGQGESDLAVPTPNNVDEPRNRRVLIAEEP